MPIYTLGNNSTQLDSSSASGGGTGGGGGLTSAQVQTQINTSLAAYNIPGQFVGEGATFAALPTVDSEGRAVTEGDWARLTADDGGNTAGVYAYESGAYVFKFSLQTAIAADQINLTTATAALTSQTTADGAIAALYNDDIQSLGINGNNLEVTLKDGSAIALDVSSFLVDEKLTAATFNTTTNNLELTVSGSATPVTASLADLLPVSTHPSISGDGTTGSPLTLEISGDANNQASLSTTDSKLFVPQAPNLTLAKLQTGTEEIQSEIEAKVIHDYVVDETKFYVPPVNQVVDTLPAVGTLTDGDRILHNTNPPVIKVVVAGAYVDEEFPDGAIASVVGTNTGAVRIGNTVTVRDFSKLGEHKTIVEVGTATILYARATGDGSDPTQLSGAYSTLDLGVILTDVAAKYKVDGDLTIDFETGATYTLGTTGTSPFPEVEGSGELILDFNTASIAIAPGATIRLQSDSRTVKTTIRQLQSLTKSSAGALSQLEFSGFSYLFLENSQIEIDNLYLYSNQVVEINNLIAAQSCSIVIEGNNRIIGRKFDCVDDGKFVISGGILEQDSGCEFRGAASNLIERYKIYGAVIKSENNITFASDGGVSTYISDRYFLAYINCIVRQWNPNGTVIDIASEDIAFLDSSNRSGTDYSNFAAPYVFFVSQIDHPPDQISYAIATVDTLPATPNAGDSYLLSSIAAANANELATWEGSAWSYRLPDDVKVLFEGERSVFYEWEASSWQRRGYARRVLTADLTIYIDSVNGNDGNDGLTTGTAYLTPQAAIDIVAATYDADNKYTITFEVVSASQSWGQINLKSVRGAEDIFLIFQAQTLGAIINTTGGSTIDSFSLNTNASWEIRRFEFVGTGQRSVARALLGTIRVADNVITGNYSHVVMTTTLGAINIANNTIKDLSAITLGIGFGQSRLWQIGEWTAEGTNAFSQGVFNPAENSVHSILATSSFTLAGGTVTGRRFFKRGNSSLQITNSDSNKIFGSLPGRIFPGGSYQGVALERYYNLILSGCDVAIAADTTKYTLSAGRVQKYSNNLTNPFWDILEIPAQEFSYPAGLAPDSSRFIRLNLNTLACETTQNSALADDLGDRIQLAEVRGDGTNITQIIPCLRYNDPRILSELTQNTGLANTGGVTLVKPDTNVKEFKLQGGQILATGYSSSGVVSIADQTTVIFDLLKSDGTILAADQTIWDYSQYEDLATGNIITVPTNNDATIQVVYLHPIDTKLKVLIGQEFYGNAATARGYQAAYNPSVVPDVLKNNSYIPICKVVGERNDGHNNLNTVSIFTFPVGATGGSAAVANVTVGDTLPLTSNADALLHLLTSSAFRNGVWYKPDTTWFPLIQAWRSADGTTAVGDLQLLEGDRVLASASSTTPVGNIALTLDASAIALSKEIEVRSDGTVNTTNRIRIDDGGTTAVNYIDNLGSVISGTMPFEIVEPNVGIKMFLLNGTWYINREF